MEPLQIVGMKELSDEERLAIEKLANEYYIKIQRMVKNLTSFVLHIKQHTKGGKRKKYSLKLRTIFATKTFESSSFDWDLNRAMHKVFQDMINEIKHKLRADSQRPKPYE